MSYKQTQRNKTRLQWRHNERDSVSNHQPHDCLLNHSFRRRSEKTSKPRVTGLCEGNSPVTGEFPAKRASEAENFSIWWRHHDTRQTPTIGKLRVRMIITNITIATNSNLYNHNKTTRPQCTLWEKLCGCSGTSQIMYKICHTDFTPYSFLLELI